MEPGVIGSNLRLTLKKAESRTGMTLIEIVIVVIIIGILASIALVRFETVVERSRSVEAKSVLGMIYRSQVVYYSENEIYAANLSDLNINVPGPALADCNSSFYFVYDISSYSTTGGQATRCMNNGKFPNSIFSYLLRITSDGDLSSNVSNML